MKSRIRDVVLLLLLLYNSAIPGTTGKITGTVKDSQTGEPLIGVNVIVEGKALGASTSVDGTYFILNVPPGKYNLVASAIGFIKKTVTDVTVSVDLTTTINFQLEATTLEGKEVIITADRPAIKKDLTSSEARVDASQIKSLPVSEVSEVLSLQSGITVDAGGGIHIRGGRTSEVAYWVDGVSVSDVYDGGQAVQVDNSAVQELQVISGTFNAEYGQAMSGIINIVTKTGQPQYHGSISAYTGSYFTSDGGRNEDRIVLFNPATMAPNLLTDKIYYNLDRVRPFDNRNLEASFSGPIPGTEHFTFYLTGRYFKSNGWLYGNRLFNTDGTLDTAAVTATSNGDGTLTVVTHDNPVAMNDRERFSGQAKLSFQFGGVGRLNLTAVGSKIDYRDYSHDWKLAPSGDVRKFDRGYDVAAVWTHTLSPTAFYDLNVSYFYKGFKEYLYENPFDPRYVIDPQITEIINQRAAQYEFIHGGTNLHHFRRQTETRVAKLDYTSQVSQLHELKAGIEGKLHRLYLEDYNLIPQQNPNGSYITAIPADTSAEYQDYTEKPVEFSGYIQDKLEYERMIVNIGLRYDYFNSHGNVLNDPYDPNVYLPQKEENQALTLDQRLAKWYRKASAKSLLSPRLGISYPITDKGVLHFSYGHFLQIPSFIYLYQRPEYKVTTASGIQGIYGNPDLNAQKTVMYEFGLQQQLTDELSFDVTGFYRDTRDWVTTGIAIPVLDPTGQTNTTSYTQYVNKDYANSRGITLTVNKRPGDLLSMNFSYTFQVAEGVNSNPDDAYAAAISNTSPVSVLTPLDWDQTHTANLTVGVGENDWGLFVLGRFGSGLPYTPVINAAEAQGADVARSFENNSRRRPANYNVDLRAFKNLKLGGVNLSAFLKVFNVFDRRNELSVFGETGRATATPLQVGLGSVSEVGLANTISSYLNHPEYFSEPREVQVGIELEF